MVNSLTDSNPLISIVIPIYKIGNINWFKECIQSIDNQTFKDFEVIIVNDGSQQIEVIDFLYTISERKNYKIIHLNINSGIGPALNEGIKVASSDLIVRMDADDIMFEDRLEKQYKFMTENPDVDVLGAGMVHMVRDKIGWVTKKNVIHPEVITKELAKDVNWFINHPTVILKKKSIDSIGGYGDHYNLPEDYELWIRMIKNNMVLRNIKDIVIKYRHNSYQFTKMENVKDKNEFMKKLKNSLYD